MNKIKQFFELNRPYTFDITDIVAIIYAVCVGGIIAGYNMTIPFFIGCLLSTVGCFAARRINLVVINIAMMVLNGYNLITMFLH